MRAHVTLQVTVEVADPAALRLVARRAVAGSDGAGADEAFLTAATATVAGCLSRLLGSPSFDALDGALADTGVRLVGVWVAERLMTIDEP